MRFHFNLDATKFIALGIAIVLWALVRGQGVGSLSIDVPLQIQGLSPKLIIVNDLPEHVRMTVSGPQMRLASLNAQDIRVSLNASAIKKSGVEEIALVADDIKLPSTLKVERVQPDRIVLQIDRIVEREIRIKPRLELPEGWILENLKIKPDKVLLKGPEVWLDALSEVKTSAIHPEAKAGKFSASAGIESPAGKAIRLVNPGIKVAVHGILSAKFETSDSLKKRSSSGPKPVVSSHKKSVDTIPKERK